MQAAWNTRIVRLVVPWIWMGLIFFLSSQSRLPNLTPQLPGLQEIAGHLAEYAVLGWLWWLALRSAGVRSPVFGALLIAVLYGVSDEFHQGFVPGRARDPFDLAMDAVGASVALVLANVWLTAKRH